MVLRCSVVGGNGDGTNGINACIRYVDIAIRLLGVFNIILFSFRIPPVRRYG